MSKIEVVMIDSLYYAIRKTTDYFFFTRETFFDLESGDVHWWPQSSKFFKDCITTTPSIVKDKLPRTASRQSRVTVIDPEDLQSQDHDTLLGMLRLSRTNKGMKDLLDQAKSYYYLALK